MPITWFENKHVSQISLNGSSTTADLGNSVPVTAQILDLSTVSRNPIQGVTIAFALGGSQCSAQTNVNGVATCSITADALASNVLTASFAGNGTWLASSASVPFFVWLRDTMFEDGFESPAPP